MQCVHEKLDSMFTDLWLFQGLPDQCYFTKNFQFVNLRCMHKLSTKFQLPFKKFFPRKKTKCGWSIKLENDRSKHLHLIVISTMSKSGLFGAQTT